MIPVGTKGFATEVVDKNNTAAALGSGFLEVYATPAMVALMEKAAAESVQPFLEATSGTVGTQINVTHAAATPLGLQVKCESEVTAVDGRKITFSITASDNAGVIGTAIHERFVIDNERFMQKAQAKQR